MQILDDLAAAIGAANVLTDDACAKWQTDWLGTYRSTPLAVVRPASTAEVSRVMEIASRHACPVTPVAGNTGLAGAATATGGIMLSLDRMRAIREVRPAARIAIVEAGVILDDLRDEAATHGLMFPLKIASGGSAMIGGALSTNAGGSNVLRYGSTRALCLGIEVVLPDGRVMDLMSELHKDNTGYDLRDLFIGAEGTLGVITAAVIKLAKAPAAYTTAMLAMRSLDDALNLLRRLQDETGNAVEAFEYMTADYVARYHALHPDRAPVFGAAQAVNILIEVAAVSDADGAIGDDGTTPLSERVEATLMALLEEGAIVDAVVARTEAQRRTLWSQREAAAEIAHGLTPFVDTDICLPLDAVPAFFDRIAPRIAALDAAYKTISVAHLGDGNIHYSLYPSRDDASLSDAMTVAVEEEVQALGGSFSAEHGIGLSKLKSMQRRKDPVALDVMRSIKAALDPANIMNPGKVIPHEPTR